MARFDIYRYRDSAAPLVVDVQADLLSSLDTRIIVPLAPKAAVRREELPRLKPTIVVGGEHYTLLTTELAAVPLSRLGERVDNVEPSHRYDITAALDFLFQGF
jgi:toxin CcdB